MINIRHKETRHAINMLAQNDITAVVQQSDKSRYDVLYNFEIVKSFRSIRSARKHIIRRCRKLNESLGKRTDVLTVSEGIAWEL